MKERGKKERERKEGRGKKGGKEVEEGNEWRKLSGKIC